jgi:hypothetical protein
VSFCLCGRIAAQCICGHKPPLQNYGALEEAERAAAKVREKIARDGDASKRREHPIGRKAWRQSYTGRQIWPLDPRPGDFAIEDLAHGLSNLARYGGQASRFYSVAEHSVLCSLFGDPVYARRRLMHDTAEAVLGLDLASPLKRHPAFSWFRAIEEPIEAAIFAQFDCEAPGDWKEIDTRILLDERAALFGPPPDDWRVPGEPLGAVISGFRPEVAKDLFLIRFGKLFPEYRGP